ncbi:ABC transporter ATP-binding protein [Oceanispirochaeta crateris]|uniref:ABC transporter ATP-binding protein n=1 Tax=Oceanispirochaeta crateris TaxID=2518645 RepID=A0A5C1QUV2_9SPIO|nr:ABC transporter ATP-binding protein [Oceanispirochaeta crateris]QEN09872.1 ABC transporter ATP-binding protein [Oceanispirochaeta crateris]
MRGITQKFGSLVANDNIDLTVHKGEVHALLGENGAGKTTLVNSLYGLYHPTSGEIFINGKKVVMDNPNIAIQNGIGMVHQHFMLIKPFSVVENIILGKETHKHGILDMAKATKDVIALSEKYGLTVDPHAAIQDITVGMQQRVEILKTLYRGADILILDEPTAVLTPHEIIDLIQIIDNLTEQGKTVIIITHKLKEIKEVADFCTIIRRGKKVDTVKVEDVSESDLASMMVGREVSFKVSKIDSTPRDTVLDVKNLHVLDNRKIPSVRGLNLKVRKGEILGIAGVDGNGQNELVEALTGIRKSESGEILVNGINTIGLSPREILNHKVSTIPQDRQKRGLILEYSVAENIIIENYKKSPFSSRGWLDFKSINEYARKLVKNFDIRPDDETYKAGDLSGGNQQKVIIAREISNNPDLLIAVQPTRGLDVGAIEYVHKALVAQRDNGKAVLLISLELDEVINVSDRIAVIYEGEIVGEMDSKGADENEISLLMAGGKKS